MKHLKGNPQDGEFGVMFCEGETIEHEYEIYSHGMPIGVLRFDVELLDGDIEDKEFEFYDKPNVHEEDRGKICEKYGGYLDSHGKHHDNWIITSRSERDREHEEFLKEARESSCGCCRGFLDNKDINKLLKSPHS